MAVSGLVMADLAHRVLSPGSSVSSGFSASASFISIPADLSTRLQNVAGKQLLLLEGL